MYYLSRLTGPCPAEAPSVARQDEKYEWDYSQRRHHDALKGMKGQVDQSKPKSINPKAQSVQKRTRSFFEDQRRAEIGRENRKLVERLASISRGYGGNDPTGPPRMSTMSKANDSTQGSGDGGFGGANAAQARASEKQQSFSDAARKMKQRMLDQDNAALVRRILATGSTFDRKAEARSFQRHKRNVNLLQRLPADNPVLNPAAGSMSPSRKRGGTGSLPPLRHSRPLSVPSAGVRGLEELFVPGELRRSGSGALAPRALTLGGYGGGAGGGILFAVPSGLGTGSSAAQAAYSTAPVRSSRQDDDDYYDEASDDDGEPSRGPSSQRSGGGGARPGRLPRDAAPPSLGKIEGLRGDSKFEPQRDEETERREWLQQEERSQHMEETLREAPSGGASIEKNPSNSELDYAEDDWDDGSFSANSPQGKAGGRGGV